MADMKKFTTISQLLTCIMQLLHLNPMLDKITQPIPTKNNLKKVLSTEGPGTITHCFYTTILKLRNVE